MKKDLFIEIANVTPIKKEEIEKLIKSGTKIKLTLKGYRVINKLKQSEVSNLVGVGRYTISDWENGRSIPSIAQIKQLAKIYNVDIKELLDVIN